MEGEGEMEAMIMTLGILLRNDPLSVLSEPQFCGPFLSGYVH